MSDTPPPHSNAVIRSGKSFELMSNDRRVALGALADHLRSERDGLQVTLELVDYIPGRRGLSVVQEVAIFVGTAAGSGFIGAAMTDVYATAKRWVKQQFVTDPGRRPQRVQVTNAEGKTLTFEVSVMGEIEHEGDR